MSARKCKTLSLIEKIRLIEEHEKNKKSAKELIQQFNVSKTQVYETLKNKDKIMNLWLSGTPGFQQRINKPSKNEDINKIVWEWFVSARSKGIPISGSSIQAEALEVAQKLGKTQFKASNGWLESFRSRHNILLYNKVGGQAKDIDIQTVEEWRQKIPNIIEGYEPKNIFNGDEIGLFFRMLPTKSLVEKDNKYVGGKMSKERLTVFLCVNMTGEFEKPIVIGKSASPKPFRHLDRDSLPVHWRFNKKAWMTGTIMEEWLDIFNEKMKNQKRHVILFLDNATCHPDILLSNIKLEWLPPNTTSITQPMDQGVISNFKCFYRRQLLRSLLFKMKNCDSVTELCKSVNVLDAVNWISKATKHVLPETIKNCFIKAGFSNFSTESNCDIEEEAHENEITELCRLINLATDSETIIHFDDNLPAFEEVEKAVDLLKNQIVEDAQEENTETDDTEESYDEKIKTFPEALSAINSLQEFSASKNIPQLMNIMEDAKNIIFAHFLKSGRQSSVTDFF